MKNPIFKKTLIVFTIISVVSLGVIGALAVIPHSHGKDLDHSRHETCPIYQFGVNHVHSDVQPVSVLVALFLVFCLVEIQKELPFVFSALSAYLRAPPVLSN